MLYIILLPQTLTFNLRHISFWFFKDAILYSVHFFVFCPPPFFFLHIVKNSLNIILDSNSILELKAKVRLAGNCVTEDPKYLLEVSLKCAKPRCEPYEFAGFVMFIK